MKQFGSPKEALWWWWEMTEIGIPLRFFRQDLARPCVQMSRQTPLVSDLWCTWVTLDMMFERMPNGYQEVIHRYFKSGRFVKPFRRWPRSGMFNAACRHFWHYLPQEFKWS